MYRKLSLSIIDYFSPFFGLSNYRFFLRKLSITHDNLIFQYLNKGFQEIEKNQEKNFKALEYFFKALKTVFPTSIKQLSICQLKQLKQLKSYFGVTFEFLPLYGKLSKITPEIIVIDKKQNLFSNYQHYF
jgi:hypothetical protein